VFIRSLVVPIAESEAIERLQRSYVGSNGHLSRPISALTRSSNGQSQDALDVVTWCYAFIDAHPAPHPLSTWREVFQWYAIGTSAFYTAPLMPANPHIDAAPVEALVARVRSIAAASVQLSTASLSELELHASLAALVFTHPVSPEQARRFVRWCANKAMFCASSSEFSTPLVTSLSSPTWYVFTTPEHPLTPEWVRSHADPPEAAAVSSFYTSMVGTAVTDRVRTAVLPEQAAAALRQLGCSVVARNDATDSAVAVAARLWDPAPRSPLHNIATAIAAATAIAR
jgi:hypothetical protein